MRSIPRALRLVALGIAALGLLAVVERPLRADETADEAIRSAYRESHGNRTEQGIAILEKYLEAHATDEKRGALRVALGDLYQRAGRTEDAKAIFRKAIDEDEEGTADAGWRLMNLLDCGFYMWSDRTWGLGETPRIGFNVWSRGEKIDRPATIPCELYKVDAAKLEAAWREHPRSLEDLLGRPPRGSAEKIASWEEPWPERNRGEPIAVKDVKAAGIYVVVARPLGVPFRLPIVVAGHALVVKRAGPEGLVFAADRASGAPIADLELATVEGSAVKTLGKTDASGCWEGKLEGNGEVAAWKDGSVAASHSWWWGTVGTGSLVTHFSTDRPIYRPGHTVHWKAIVRTLTAAGDYALPEAGKTWHASARDPNGAEVWKGDVTANAYGTVGGDLELKEGCPLGHYTIDVGTGTLGEFRVEEYRKPEFQVKVDAPSSVVQGDTLHAKVSATYYFGAPVTKGHVVWEVHRQPHWRAWWTLFPCRDGWFFEDEDDFRVRGWYGRGGELVSQGTGETGKDGTFAVDVPVERKEDPKTRFQDESLTVVARVSDASRREESGSAEVLAPRASFSLYAQPQRWVYRPGDEVSLDVQALDPESKPRSGVALTGTATIREWESGKGYREGKKVATVEAKTDDAGRAVLKLSADARGSIEVAIVAQDEKGREVRTDAYVWQADELWASPTRTSMECVADRRSYSIGDTATVLCTMPAEKGSALVTLERDGILSHSVQAWEKGVLLLPTKVEERDMPNVFVTVTAVSGALHQGTAEIVVVPEKRLLDVSVSFDKATYQPREKAVVKVKAIDRVTKAPARAEVALGVVDASLYALAGDPAVDLRKFFYKRRPHTVQTASSFEWWVAGKAGANAATLGGAADRGAAAPGAPPVPQAAARAKVAGEAGGALVEAQVREDFPDTWAWRGTLETDANGEAVLELTVPDSLTTWRATARAVTRETQVGSATAEAKVFLPVLVRVEPPRFLVQGDVGGISALVHNYLDQGKKTKVSWTVAGPVTLGKPTVSGGELMELSDGSAWIAIPSQGEARLDWFEAHADKPGKVELEVKAQTDEASDAMRPPAFPVLAHGAPRFASWAGALEDASGSDAGSPSATTSQTIELPIPEGSIPEAVEVELSITPSVAATMLDSLESLAGYPYGCVEQTMSRFLPDIVAVDTLRKLSVDEPALRAELPKMIEKGLARLSGYQHPDGGWGWWEHDATHPYMTAYVVYGLSLARAADVKVDDGMYKRGVAALDHLLGGKARAAHGADEEDANARAYMLFALSQAKKVPAAALEKAFAKRDQLDNYGKAVLARALFRSGASENATALAKELVAKATTLGTTCQWTATAGTHGWTSLDTETTAQVLQALEEIGEGKELWTKAVRWLVAHRRGRWWYSTRDTAMAVFALAGHVSMTNELDADEDVAIAVGDKELVKQHVDRSNVLATRVGLKLGMADLGGARTVTFKRSGKGLAYYAAHLRTTAFEEDLKASPGAMTCSRSIVVVHRAADGTETRAPLGKEPVHVGDELDVTLRVLAGEAREYLLVEDPIPAGCEFVREDLGGENGGGVRLPRRGRRGLGDFAWSYWYAHREYRDDRLAVCATTIDANHEQVIEYLLRCERPGDFHVLPLRATDMYDADQGGTGAEDRLSIR
jgi:uncharacterized protein YfaS (alpha-2-macroglobulin family)